MHRIAEQMITNVKKFTEKDFTGDPVSLGEGREGSVYRWRSNDFGRDLAVKMLNTDLPLSKMTEAQLLIRTSNHTNIITIYGLYQDASRFSQTGFKGYVMEYSEIGSLDNVVFNTDRSYPDSQVYEWMRQAALGLQHLHKSNIIHRDIKLQNMILMTDGTLKISDFGLSKDLESTATCSFAMCGSPGFMAPEIHRFAYSDKSDVYDFSMTVWQMFHREHFTSYPDIRNGIREYFEFMENPRNRPVCKLRVDEKVRSLLRKGWANLPENRPPIGAFITLANELVQCGSSAPMPVPSAPMEDSVVERQQEMPKGPVVGRRPLVPAKHDTGEERRREAGRLLREFFENLHLKKIACNSDPALRGKSYTFNLITIKPEFFANRVHRYFGLLSAQEWVSLHNSFSILAKQIRGDKLEGKSFRAFPPSNFSQEQVDVIDNFVKAQPTHKGLHLYEICLAGGDVLVLTYTPSNSTPKEIEQYAKTIENCLPPTIPSITKTATVLDYVPEDKHLLEALRRKVLCIDTTEKSRFHAILETMIKYIGRFREDESSNGPSQLCLGNGYNLELIIPEFQKKRLKKSMWAEVNEIHGLFDNIDEIIIFGDSSAKHDKPSQKEVDFGGQAKLIFIHCIDGQTREKIESMKVFDAIFHIWKATEKEDVLLVFQTLNRLSYGDKRGVDGRHVFPLSELE